MKLFTIQDSLTRSNVFGVLGSCNSSFGMTSFPLWIVRRPIALSSACSLVYRNYIAIHRDGVFSRTSLGFELRIFTRNYYACARVRLTWRFDPGISNHNGINFFINQFLVMWNVTWRTISQVF